LLIGDKAISAYHLLTVICAASQDNFIKTSRLLI